MLSINDPFIDCDSHITEPPDLWKRYLPSPIRKFAPSVERDSSNDREYWYFGKDRITGVAAFSWAGWHEAFPYTPPTFKEIQPACYDAKQRLAWMDEQGCLAQVLYPNLIGTAGERCLKVPDAKLGLALLQAYNTFVADWASDHPTRLIPLAALPFWNLDATFKEIQRCESLGFRGFLFPGTPDRHGQPKIADPYWNPLWEKLEASGWPVHLHIGSGHNLEGYNANKMEHEGFLASFARVSLSLFLSNALHISEFLFSGVFERFPGLKMVSAESGIGWIPFALETLDYEYTMMEMGKRQQVLPHLPSYYFSRNIWCCASVAEKRLFPQLVETIGADRILFETDFPHPNCLHQNVQAHIKSRLGAMEKQTRQKVLLQNAADLYQLKREGF